VKAHKYRLIDLFREMDTDNSGMIDIEEFKNGLMNTGFGVTADELDRLFTNFDADGNNEIDYYEFLSALYDAKDAQKNESEADKIHDEVMRQVSRCKWKGRVVQVSDNKYKFGEAQQLRLVRFLSGNVAMVRVGGGWVKLSEFLKRNDPCRAIGRTRTPDKGSMMAFHRKR